MASCIETDPTILSSGPAYSKSKIFNRIANHRFSSTQIKQTNFLFISGSGPKVETEPNPFH